MTKLQYAIVLAFLSFSFACTGEAERGEPRRVSAADAKSAEPAIAQAPDGGAYLVYVEHRGDGGDIVLQPLDSDGKPRGERVRVNSEANNAKAWRGDPPTIAVGPDGAIYVGWTRRLTDTTKRGNDLMLSVSRDKGRSFDPPVKVNDDQEPASHGMHSIAMDASGKIIMAWLDERSVGKNPHNMAESGAMHHEAVEPNSEVYTAVSVDGGKTFSPNKKIAEEVCPCCKTSLLAVDGGKVYASWRQVLEGDHRHIAVAASTDGGKTFGTGVIVSDDNWQIAACPVSGAALASVGSNQLDVTWYTAGVAGVTGIYSARSSDGGKSFAQRRLLSSTAAAGTPIAGTAYLVFNSTDNSVIARPIGGSSSGVKLVDIPNAAVPSSASLNDRTLVAFVRPDGDSPSIWVSSIPN